MAAETGVHFRLSHSSKTAPPAEPPRARIALCVEARGQVIGMTETLKLSSLAAAALAPLLLAACSERPRGATDEGPASLADYAAGAAVARAPDVRQARVIAVAETPDHKAACGVLRVGEDEDIPFIIELARPYGPGETTPPQVATGEGATPRTKPYLAERARQYTERCKALGLDLATLPRR